MSSTVIECWSKLLNQIESDANEVQRMAFLGIRHTDVVMRWLENQEAGVQETQTGAYYDTLFHIWDLYIKHCGHTFNLNAELIFVPVNIDDHFACICINFISRTIDVLDHQLYLQFKSSKVFKVSKIISGAMSDYLESRGVSGAEEVAKFRQRQIKLSWQSPKPNDLESGLFTMMHMLCYEGAPFEHEDLPKKVGRRYLCIQLAATLVLSDMNKVRAETMDNVKKFIAQKESLWQVVYARRKVSKILNKK
ncbi:uncharacterized protein LOC141630592 [Silene latifolia]|uniref:uncharacterized protein LOC141630592 n=1 Tax=Silene latifolia TaxID=37657 RepID=UPI003D784FE8